MTTATSFASYRASGRFGALTLALFAAAIVAGAAAAWLYQSLMSWIPYIYINLVLCGGFGAVLGVAGMYAVRLGHCRNRILAGVLALPLALVPVAASYYWSYRSTLATIADKSGTALETVREEIPFERWLDLRREVGWTMTSSHSTPSRRNSPDISGLGVVVVWGVEALVILAIALLLVDAEASRPYCERCGRWCSARPLTLGGLGRDDVAQAVQLGDLMPLIDIQLRADGDRARSLLMTGHVCAGCTDTAFLSVDEKTTTQRKKQTSTKSVKLIKLAILTQQQRAAFVQRYNFAVGQKLAA